MIGRSQQEDWVLALRVFIKDTLGTSWQIIENKGKVSLGIGLTLKDISFVIGHTTEVHQQNYARFIPTGTFDKFAKQLRT